MSKREALESCLYESLTNNETKTCIGNWDYIEHLHPNNYFKTTKEMTDKILKMMDEWENEKTKN